MPLQPVDRTTATAERETSDEQEPVRPYLDGVIDTRRREELRHTDFERISKAFKDAGVSFKVASDRKTGLQGETSRNGVLVLHGFKCDSDELPDAEDETMAKLRAWNFVANCLEVFRKVISDHESGGEKVRHVIIRCYNSTGELWLPLLIIVTYAHDTT